MAPRTRPAHRDEMTAAIQLVQEHLHSLAPQAYTPATLPQTRDPGLCRENRTNIKKITFLIIPLIQIHFISLLFHVYFTILAPSRLLESRLQLEAAESSDGGEQSDYGGLIFHCFISFIPECTVHFVNSSVTSRQTTEIPRCWITGDHSAWSLIFAQSWLPDKCQTLLS